MRVGTASGRESAAREPGAMCIGAKSAVPTLRKALKDSSIYVRNAAAWALGEIGTPEAFQALKEYERS
jgi:HEAT repeat protein